MTKSLSSEVRGYHLGILLTEGERFTLAMAARRDKRSMASWVRRRILDALVEAESGVDRKVER